MAAILKRRLPVFSTFIKTLLDDATAAAARATLGLDLIGMVVPTARTTAHTGWLLCHGQNVSRTTYAALFTAIGTTYGVGDGSTTFALPDIRGRVIAGKDDMGGTSANRLTSPINGDNLGAAGGSEGHQLTADQQASMPVTGDGIAVYNNWIGGGIPIRTTSVTTVSAESGPLTAVGGGQAHNNVQPTIVLNYMIFAGV